MFAQVSRLRYWKSEHEEDTCEDAYGENIVDGLFAVSDGAGTTLFSGAWAAVLVEHFLRVPLMSTDPFEVEWWVSLAQEQFKRNVPEPENMAWNAVQKAHNQGSHATLATLRIARSDATHAQADLLVFGDSCIIVDKPSIEHVLSFPLEDPHEFEQAPICVPSKPALFNRYFHQCQAISLTLGADDVVVLATDAVSKWILSAGGGRYSNQKQAFAAVAQQTADSWPSFIRECRARKEMVDDDSTALIIGLLPDSSSQGTPLGSTREHSKQVREERKRHFMQMHAAQNTERVAIYFGDGMDLRLEGVDLPQHQIRYAREVADAQKAVLTALRQELNNPNVGTIITPIWQKYAHLLYFEPCAENLRKTLTGLGVRIERPAVQREQVELPASPNEPEMLETREFPLDLTAILRSPQPMAPEEP